MFLISSPTTDGRPPSQFLPLSHHYLAQLGFVSPGLLFSSCALLLCFVLGFFYHVIKRGLGRFGTAEPEKQQVFKPVHIHQLYMKGVVSVSLTSNYFRDV